MTKFDKYPEFEKNAGEDTIESLKAKWLDKIGPFPEPTLVEGVLDDAMKGTNNEEDSKDEKKDTADEKKDKRLRRGNRYHVMN